MMDLHDATQEMLEIQCSSAQDLADTTSVVGQASQDANEAKPKSSSYALFTRSGVPVFKYSDSEPSQVSANSPGQFRSSEDILAWAIDVVGGNDEELSFQGPNKSDVFMIKRLPYVKTCFRKSFRIDFTIFKSSWCGMDHPISLEARQYNGSG